MHQIIQYGHFIPYRLEEKFAAELFNGLTEVTKDRKVKSHNEDFCIKLGLPKSISSVEG